MPFTSHTQKLAAPTLYQTNKNTICALAAEQLFITILPYPNMEEGDLIELFWDGCYVTSQQVGKLASWMWGSPASLECLRVSFRTVRPGFIIASCISAAALHFPLNSKSW